VDMDLDQLLAADTAGKTAAECTEPMVDRGTVAALARSKTPGRLAARIDHQRAEVQMWTDRPWGCTEAAAAAAGMDPL
jgi:hypothetical protein